MSMRALRQQLETSLELLAAVESSDERVTAAADKIKHALRETEPTTLMTTAEAAEALGVRSITAA